MAKQFDEAIGRALGHAAREAAENVAGNARKRADHGSRPGAKSIAAGLALAGLAPLAVKGAGRLASAAKDSIGKGAKAGGIAGLAAQAAKGVLPSGIGDDDDNGGKNDMPGAGRGRRMPVQQGVDVAVPISTAYNAWTQFEDWPKFMHRLEAVSQEDRTHVKFKTKIWGISKDFEAEIVEQRPDDRIMWEVTEGVAHTGVVTFHELADRLTRVEVSVDVEPASLIEKAGRGMRHVKRAVRADLARFKAYVEMQDEEPDAWRGVIEDGKVKRSRRSSSKNGGGSSSSSSNSKSKSKPKSKSTSSGGRAKSASSGSKTASSRSRTRSASSRGKASSGGSKASSGGRKASSGGSKASSGGSKASSGRSKSSSGGSKSSSNRNGGSSSRARSSTSRNGSSSSRSRSSSSRSKSSSGGSKKGARS